MGLEARSGVMELTRFGVQLRIRRTALASLSQRACQQHWPALRLQYTAHSRIKVESEKMPQEAVGLRRGLEPSSSFSFPHFVLHWTNSSQLGVILPQVSFLVVTNRNIYIFGIKCQ